MNEAMTSVQGLSQLLRAVAGRMEGSVDGLNKELLLQSAEQLDKLETVADVAEMIIDKVPHGKRGRIRDGCDGYCRAPDGVGCGARCCWSPCSSW